MLRKSQFYLTFCLTIYRGKVAPVTNYASHLDDVWGSGGTASVVRSLGAILLLLFTVIEFSLGGNSSYTSTDKTNKN